ncbi:molybdopterin cofactor-binding domain-containing protein [Polynucleobacter necessarius]|uniref:molybdopterin cofactor-binding domain-containing protein n=1 Tax=Polynucleobacter necessarius TaxID=576610 RepID=UPI0018D5337C|nr:molybdopterin cofactor-binding domain-containing protein [Polynucleobacter necessarius]
MHIKVAGQSINATLAPQNIKDGKDERQLQGFYEKVTRLVFALNSGHVVNPYLTREQIEGSVAMALGAIFLPEISVEKGRIRQQNLDTYPLLKLSATPRIETVLVPTYDFWGGVGEPTICVVGLAVANAVSAAIGRPVRNFPLSKEGLTLAKVLPRLYLEK